MGQLLKAYQLWLDDLYPRAKFADGLVIIEKLGHTKRMQTMRREWIQDGKTRETLGGLGVGAQNSAGQLKSKQDQCWKFGPRDRSRTPVALVGDNDDLYAATPKSSRDVGTSIGNGGTEKLVLEDSTKTVPILEQKRGNPATEETFDDDDEEALLALNGVW